MSTPPTNGEAWRNLFRVEWWLDAVAPSEWREVTVTKDGAVAAHLAFVPGTRRGMRRLYAPRLTPRLGPWVDGGPGRPSTRIAREEELLNELVDALPPHDRFHQNCHPSFTNWLPLSWRGFTQTTRYSFVLDDLSDLDAIWDAFESRHRRDIRRAEEQLTVRDDRGVEPLVTLVDDTYRQQGLATPIPGSTLSRVFSASVDHDAGRVSYAVDEHGEVHAGMLVVWDATRAYYLLGGTARSQPGAMTMLVWDTIRYASGVTRCFDFEGSMILPIAHFFRGFGAVPEPYSALSRLSRRAEVVDALRVLAPPAREAVLMALVVETPPTYGAERTYALRTVLGAFLGLEFGHAVGPAGVVRITGDDGRTLELPDVLFGVGEADWLTPRCLPAEPLARTRIDGSGLRAPLVEPELPVIFGTAPPLVERRDPSVVALNLDVFGAAFFMLSRMEEVVRTDRDDHGRFPAAESLAWREGFLTRPVVDEYVELLWACLRELWPRLERTPVSFSVFSTHDVDTAFEYHNVGLGGLRA